MFSQLMSLLQSPTPPRAPHPRLSVAVLMLEAARQDDKFDASERAAIERLLVQRFGLTAAECTDLMETAQAHAHSMVQLHGHTSEIAREMSPQERVQLIEMLWEVAYADGVLDPEEDLLIRRIANLIYVTDRDRVLARQRVVARREQSS
ncbi:MAG TPA: TerB family tellurite resistance protein [Rhizomicrobium sp.]|nr:TerB family tellurite resistance protein [Rhizomicrobium sp.]